MWIRAVIGAGIGLAGVGVSITALTYGADLHAVTVGVTAAILGACVIASGVICRVVAKPTAAVDAAFEQGHQLGYDKGYWEGRRTARPVVVPLREVVDVRTPTAVEEVAGDDPAARREATHLHGQAQGRGDALGGRAGVPHPSRRLVRQSGDTHHV